MGTGHNGAVAMHTRKVAEERGRTAGPEGRAQAAPRVPHTVRGAKTRLAKLPRFRLLAGSERLNLRELCAKAKRLGMSWQTCRRWSGPLNGDGRGSRAKLWCMGWLISCGLPMAIYFTHCAQLAVCSLLRGLFSEYWNDNRALFQAYRCTLQVWPSPTEPRGTVHLPMRVHAQHPPSTMAY